MVPYERYIIWVDSVSYNHKYFDNISHYIFHLPIGSNKWNVYYISYGVKNKMQASLSSKLKSSRLQNLLSVAQQSSGNLNSLGLVALGTWPLIVTLIGLAGLLIVQVALASQESARNSETQQTLYYTFIIIFVSITAIGLVLSLLSFQGLIQEVQEAALADQPMFAFRTAIEEATRQATLSLVDADLIKSIQTLLKGAESGSIKAEAALEAAQNISEKLSPEIQKKIVPTLERIARSTSPAAASAASSLASSLASSVSNSASSSIGSSSFAPGSAFGQIPASVPTNVFGAVAPVQQGSSFGNFSTIGQMGSTMGSTPILPGADFFTGRTSAQRTISEGRKKPFGTFESSIKNS